jgi:hypothetical protein
MIEITKELDSDILRVFRHRPIIVIIITVLSIIIISTIIDYFYNNIILFRLLILDNQKSFATFMLLVAIATFTMFAICAPERVVARGVNGYEIIDLRDVALTLKRRTPRRSHDLIVNPAIILSIVTVVTYVIMKIFL